ncbi:MAG: ester cyclase [Chloroflexota bacterium]|nr:ester cyclase [Chloroflexota bacterium]
MRDARDDQESGRRSDRLSRRMALRGAAAGGFVALAVGAAPRALAQATPAAMPPIVDQWLAAWNAHNPEQMAALFTEDGVYEDLAFEFVLEGRQGVATWVTITLAGAPDMRAELVYAFQAGDRAAAHWIFSGTHTGEWGPDLPPTGQPFALSVASLFELEGDLIRRVGDYYNLATFLRQVGLAAGPYTPPQAPPAATPTG